jgi:hypothetical protein
MGVLHVWRQFEWILPIFHKGYFKKWTSGRPNYKKKKSQDMNHYDTLIRQLCPRAVEALSPLMCERMVI